MTLAPTPKREAVILPASPHQELMAVLLTQNALLMDVVKLLEDIAHNTKQRKVK